jgi:hypothetical protein
MEAAVARGGGAWLAVFVNGKICDNVIGCIPDPARQIAGSHARFMKTTPLLSRCCSFRTMQAQLFCRNTSPFSKHTITLLKAQRCFLCRHSGSSWSLPLSRNLRKGTTYQYNPPPAASLPSINNRQEGKLQNMDGLQEKVQISASGIQWQRGKNGRLIRLPTVFDSEQQILTCTQSNGTRSQKSWTSHCSMLKKSPSDLGDLPDEVVAQIFSNFPFNEVLQLASVCTSWQRASRMPQAFTNVDFTWVDLLPQQLLPEFLDLGAPNYEPPPKRSGRLAEYLLHRASALTSMRLGLACIRSERKGMLSTPQLLRLVSACQNLRTLHLFQPNSPCGLPVGLQQEVLKVAARSCQLLSYLEVSAASFAGAGEQAALMRLVLLSRCHEK